SLPHGSVDRNPVSCGRGGSVPLSLPHGSVDRNYKYLASGANLDESLPHGSVDRNRGHGRPPSIRYCRSLTGAWIETRHGVLRCHDSHRRSLTGAWIETASARLIPSAAITSLPHGSVDRNLHHEMKAPRAGRRSLTGAWIETR